MRGTKSGKVARDGRIPQRAARLAAGRRDLFRPLPLAHQPAVDRIRLGIVEQRRDLVQLVAGQRRPPRRRNEARTTGSRSPAPARARPSVEAARSGRGTQADRARQPLRPEIAVVAGEQLVAAVARQRDGDVLARQFGDEIGRDLRGIGERLVEPVRQLRNDVERVPRLDIEFGVVGAEMGGDPLGALRPRRSRSRGSRWRRSSPAACSAPASRRPRSRNRSRPRGTRRAARRRSSAA